MAHFDYIPRWGGVVVDPVANGGAVTRLTLFSDPERTTVVAVADAARRLLYGPYRFDVPGTVPPGRYWATVLFTPSAGTAPVADQVRADLPAGIGLVATPEQVADHLGTELPLTPAIREQYLVAIEEAQADVEAYLGRPLCPRALTLTGVRPNPGLPPSDPRAWPIPPMTDKVVVASFARQADGSYRVELQVGLDGAAEGPIRRFVAAHAAEALRLRSGEGRRVASVSAEGQSISYEAAARAGEPGSLPQIEGLRRYRRAAVYQSTRGTHTPLFPYGSRW